MSHDMRQVISDELVVLITECEKIIADTTGRLEGENEQSLNAELTSEKSPVFDDLTEEQVTEQVMKICKRTNATKAGQTKCFEETLAKISSE